MITNILTSLLVTLGSCSNSYLSSAELNKEYYQDVSKCHLIAKEMNIRDEIEGVNVVRDFDNNEYYVKTGLNSGFIVYDPISDTFLEKSAEMISPYDFSSNKDYLYLGPMNYYEKCGDLYYSLWDDEYVTVDDIEMLQASFNSSLERIRNENSTSPNAIDPVDPDIGGGGGELTEVKYIDNYQIIKNAKVPSNTDGRCGFVATGLILNYLDKTLYTGTIPSKYLDSNGDIYDDSTKFSPDTELIDKLVDLNPGKPSSWGFDVSVAVNSFALEYNLDVHSTWSLFNAFGEDDIEANRPMILFGSIPSIYNSQNINHAVVAYGLNGEDPIVHYGYSGENSKEVVLNSGLIGSSAVIKLPNYDNSVYLTDNVYNFDSYYATTPTTQTHTVGNYSFDTTIYRVGYIENEYVTLSPRKEGYGTAYIEYNFSQPVYSIDVDLSFWSDDERYYEQDHPKAVVEYKHLYDDNTWVQAADLLALDLPVDRKNPKTYTFTFPKRTKTIRFYTHFNSMSGQTDRNKGRICIGNMLVHTFYK